MDVFYTILVSIVNKIFSEVRYQKNIVTKLCRPRLAEFEVTPLKVSLMNFNFISKHLKELIADIKRQKEVKKSKDEERLSC